MSYRRRQKGDRYRRKQDPGCQLLARQRQRAAVYVAPQPQQHSRRSLRKAELRLQTLLVIHFERQLEREFGFAGKRLEEHEARKLFRPVSRLVVQALQPVNDDQPMSEAA
jgi:hypothetical protein